MLLKLMEKAINDGLGKYNKGKSNPKKTNPYLLLPYNNLRRVYKSGALKLSCVNIVGPQNGIVVVLCHAIPVTHRIAVVPAKQRFKFSHIHLIYWWGFMLLIISFPVFHHLELQEEIGIILYHEEMLVMVSFHHWSCLFFMIMYIW